MKNKVVVYGLKTNTGFILVEVMLATVIISVALVGITGMFIQAIQADTMARDYTIAANLAQQQLELLKTNPPTYWSGLVLPCTIPWCDELQLPPPRYKLTTNAVSVADDDHLVQVTIVAYWQERGKEYSLQFITWYPAI